jgi:hypothetical protein
MTTKHAFGACLAALTLLIGGCASSADLVTSSPTDESSDGDEEEPDDVLSVPAELPTTAQAYERKPAARLLRKAKRSLVLSGSGRFDHITSAGNAEGTIRATIIRSHGVYDLHRVRSRTRLVLVDDSGAAALTIRAITRARRAFLRLSEWPCWLLMTPDDYGKAAGVDVAAGAVQFPAEVQGLLTARAVTRQPGEPGVVVATMPMRFVAPLVSPNLGEKLYRQRSGIRVPVVIIMRSKQIVGWELHGVDVLAALEKSPIRLGKRMRTALPYVKASVRLRDHGSRVRVPLPPKRLWVRGPAVDSPSCEGRDAV